MECSPVFLYNNYNLVRVISAFPCGLADPVGLRLMTKLGRGISSRKGLLKMGKELTDL